VCIGNEKKVECDMSQELIYLKEHKIKQDCTWDRARQAGVPY